MHALFLALRYLRANRIMSFAIAGVAIGIAVMIVVTSLMGGFARDLRERIRGMQSHLSVIPDRDTGFTTDPAPLLDRIRKLDHVIWASPRLEYAAWMGLRGSRRPVRLIGIDPTQEKDADLREYFRRGGTDLDALAGDWAVAGWELPVEPGQPCLLMSIGLDEWPPAICIVPRTDLFFNVAGKFRSGLWEYDTTTVFLPIDRMRTFLKMEGPAVSVLAVEVDDYARHGLPVQAAIFPMLAAEGKFGTVRTWEEVQDTLLRAVESETVIQIVILFFIILVASFTILSIYMMMVRAKTRDIGVLRALGVTGPGIARIFVLSGALCGLIGSIIGIGLGLFIALSLDGFALYVRAVTRGLAEQPRWEAWLALACFVASAAALIAGWRRLYSDRSWKLGAAAAALALVGLHFYGHWSSGFVPNPELREPGPWSGFPLGMLIWISVSLLLTALRPAALVTIGNAGLAAGLLVVGALTASVALKDPLPGFAGFDLFPRQVYHLDRVPAHVDGAWILAIVAVTLVIGAVASLFPAVRASLVNPMDAIRDE